MEITPDFKMVIVLDDELSIGLKANTAAVLSITLGNKISGLVGIDLLDADKKIHTGLTNIPLPILKIDANGLEKLYELAFSLRNEILLVDVTDAAQTTKNYEDYQLKLEQNKNAS